MELSNYRPISVFNILSKILERLMYNKLIQFFDQYNALYQNHFGFRQGHSTNHAFITLVDNITKSLDDGDIVIGVFFDLKKHLIRSITKSDWKIIPLWNSWECT